MTPQLVLEADLLAATQYIRPGDLERWLRDNHVLYFRGKDGHIFTTVGLLEAAKLAENPLAQLEPEPVRF